MPDTTTSMSLAVTNLAAGTDRRVLLRAIWAGLWIWPSFTLLDAYMCFVVYPGAPFLLFVAYRVIVEVAFLALFRYSRRETVSMARVAFWQKLIFAACAVTISLMAIQLGGITSPYMHGISIVALVWAALIPSPWRQILPAFCCVGLSFPAVMALAAAVSPTARATWIHAEAFKIFGANYVFVIASSALGVILSHMVWRAQQRARSLGSYRLEERLGEGGMGEVWRARHRMLARRAAVKLIRPESLGNDPQSRQVALARFEREAQATASLRSPHTVALYDFGVSVGGRFYYVMELLEGSDAAMLVERFGPVPAARAVYLLRQACESLGEAHAAGLIHRDIKPSNVFVCRYGRAYDFVKVLDFGLVKSSRENGAGLTAEHVVSGTPSFMSPEQVLGNRTLDARSDLYALGCVAYWLLTGQHVFEGSTAMEVLTEQVHAKPVPPSQRSELPIPPALEKLVLACLEKGAGDRPQSADELAAALADVPLEEPWTQEQARLWWEQHRP